MNAKKRQWLNNLRLHKEQMRIEREMRKRINSKGAEIKQKGGN